MMPYIGVTDFTSRDQVEQVKKHIPNHINRRLHVGAMTSYKTQNYIPTSAGWEKIWLPSHALQQLFVDDDQVYNVIHYADYGHTDTSRAPTTVFDLVHAWDMCGPHVHAIQLDMVWPEESLIREFKHVVPTSQIILQVSSTALEFSDPHVDWREVLGPYEQLVDYVLIDTGMGKGIVFDPSKALERVEGAIQVGFDPDRIVVAGGLGPDTYTNLKLILDIYPDVSCDAQGRLRSSHNSRDPLNLQRVEQYVAGVCSLLSTEGTPA